MSEKPDVIEIEPDGDRTHALLCAIVMARHKAESSGYMDHYLDEWDELERILEDVYFRERR